MFRFAVFRVAAAVALFICPAAVFVCRSAAQDLEPKEVKRAIDQGVQYLKNKQQKNGNWKEYPGETVGPTALVVLALISSGVPKDDPAIDRSMNYLRLFHGNKAGRNYAVSLQTMAFCLVEPERDLAHIRENVELLEKSQNREHSEHNGGWDYVAIDGNQRTDLSNSQFSILALYEAERVGVSVPKEVWQRASRYWLNTQNKDGSWGYTPSPNGGCSGSGHGSMTCAGIASTVITSGIIGAGGAKINGNKILCSLPSNRKETEQIEAGIDWLGRHFSVSQNPQYSSYHYYYLYALERVGRMTNRRFIGQHDWYREGAAQLLRSRDEFTGCWKGKGFAENDIVATSFALLFLSKGRRPVLMSKVQFGRNDNWNIHPNDVNNITAFAEKNWKIDLTWQSIDIEKSTVDDLTQTPVLHFCGKDSPLLGSKKDAEALVHKLRDYLEQGGFILAESQPNGEAFDKGFRELMKMMFPEEGYELRLLDSSHPIWSAEMPVEPEYMRTLEGISFGCRTSIVYAPPFKDKQTGSKMPSLSCLWEAADIYNRREDIESSVQRKIDAGLKTGLNILTYATNRELKYKDEIAQSAEKKTAESGSLRGTVFIGVLKHSGGTGSAPHAASNLLRWVNTNFGIPVVSKTESVLLNNDDLLSYPFLMMHGRENFEWTKEQCGILKNHLESGGFLFADAVCSSKQFDISFLAAMKNVFPNQELQRIPSDDPLFSEQYGGDKIRTLPIRLPERSPERKTMVSERLVEPELYGIQHNGRWVVVYSPNDVSCALESANSLECRGYTPKGAMQLGVNVLFYALEHW
jgi:hypothetical protein